MPVQIIYRKARPKFAKCGKTGCSTQTFIERKAAVFI